MIFSSKRIDAWINAVTGLGKRKRDRTLETLYGLRERLPHHMLEALYEQNGLAARIVDRLPDDMMREPFTLEGLDIPVDPNQFQSDLDNLGFAVNAADGIRWSRLYGGSLVHPIITGEDPETPLNLNTIKNIERLEVIESRYVTPIQNKETHSFLNPEMYQINSMEKRDIVQIHPTRVYRFDGMRSPRALLAHNGGWAASVLNRVYESLAGVGEAYASARNLLAVISQPVLTIEGMKANLYESKKGKQQLADLIADMQEAASILRWIVIDSKDKFEMVDRNVAGVVEILLESKNMVVSESGMPVEILLGLTQSGMNTGENEGPFRMWYDSVGFSQKQILSPFVNWFLSLYFNAEKNSGRRKELPTVWKIKYPSLWQPSAAIKAETELKEAQRDTAHYSMGAIEASEVRKGRYVNKGEIMVEPTPEVIPFDLSLPDPPDEPDGGEPGAAPAAALPVAGAGPVPAPPASDPAALAPLLALAKAVRAGEITAADAMAIVLASYPHLNTAALLVALGTPQPGADPAAATVPVAEVDDPVTVPEPVESIHAPPEGETLLSPREIAAALGVSTVAINNMHRRGEIEGWKIGGHFRYALTHVTAAAHQPAVTPEPEPEPDAKHKGKSKGKK